MNIKPTGGFKLRKNSEFDRHRKVSIASNTSPLQRPMKAPVEGNHSDSDSEKPLKKQIRIVSQNNLSSATNTAAPSATMTSMPSSLKPSTTLPKPSDNGLNGEGGGGEASKESRLMTNDDELNNATCIKQEEVPTANVLPNTATATRSSRSNIFSNLGTKK